MSAFLICWVAVLVKAVWLPRICKLHVTSFSLFCPTGSWIARMEGGRASANSTGLSQFTAVCRTGESLGKKCGVTNVSPYRISNWNGMDGVIWGTSSVDFVYSLKFLYQGYVVGTLPGNPRWSQEWPTGQRITGVRTYCGAVRDGIQFHFSLPNPTKEPTQMPTNNPPDVPTWMPTMKPPKMPSSEPTEFPSGVPTMILWKMPSSKPTEVPTQMPTMSPSSKPTEVPLQMQTMSPTSEPTEFPSGVPTMVPSMMPSSKPTAVPTQTGENVYNYARYDHTCGIVYFIVWSYIFATSKQKAEADTWNPGISRSSWNHY